MNQPRRYLLLLLLVTIVLSLYAEGSDNDTDVVEAAVRPVPVVSPTTATERSVPPPVLQPLSLPVTAAVPKDALFAVRDWAPPPPVIPPAPPQAPTAPPLPFRFMGRLTEDGGKPQVYLVNGDQLHTVREGDTIDGVYKVQRLERSEMTLVYLPLNQQQILPIGGDN